ncbi:MAG TPA: hypothetical protein VND92_01425, partial [Vicinamibacterales bacterium]|nr:hypothetical protein [Vicinamibacterales bacterium]
FGFAWAFATIWPAIFEAADLIAGLRQGEPMPATAASPLTRRFSPGAMLSMLAGAVMLIWPIVRPSPWLAPPVWLGFILLLDPINARAGGESLGHDLRHGRFERLGNLILAGFLCGLLWEFWNYWARTRWIYTVPYLPHVRIFEMPVLGYFGFPAFALECFTMYVTLRLLVWRGRTFDIGV